mmetsp:Transcript_29364/g.50044  ORF Transcript_29364/g.50044 Transcript_29364/m.50044 type:complete len:435 (-) Transcript_29364:246-1550(-)
MAMVSPTMKKRTVTAAYASAAAWFPSPSELSDSKDVYIKKADAATTPTPTQAAAAAAAAPDGLDLLFAASQAEAETKLKCKESDANSAGAEDGAKVPSTITVVSNEPVADNDESRDNDNEPENLATAALKNQEESFPQVLHEILATTECQSIVHWLPDGLSFIIADKERFSSEILPKYFRGALLNSVIRKLNRWGFRRVKSRRKGEESSFANVNFVRDKPWLCLRMKCKSKPTYHKVKVSSTSTKKKSNKKKAKQNTSEASNRNILANAATASVVVHVHAPAQAPRLPPPPFLAASGIMSRTFVPTSTYSRVTTAAEHEPLPLSNPKPALLTVTAPAAGSLSAAVASTIQERQYLASIPLYHQQRIFHERQILIAQMRQRHQVQMELQRLNDMSSHIGEQFASSRNGNVQNAMMAQCARDTWNGRNIYYGGERK